MESGAEQAERARRTAGRLAPLEILILAAWSGLAAGELEVAARWGVRLFSSTNRLYLMTRHFVWLVPVLNASLFLFIGVLCALAARRWPGPAGWLGPRLLVVLAVLPSLLIIGHGIYGSAWLVFAMGLAVWLTPLLVRFLFDRRGRLLASSALLAAAVLTQAGWLVAGDALKRWREEGRPLPPPGSPNVLLIVLDTVRADHLGVYGYERPTTPHLDQLARRSIRFDQARATAPWTLASHASLFTGRGPGELGIRWMLPLRRGVPVLAEYLGSIGYSTGGFVGNTFYCAYDSGLDRGFAHYEDYELDRPASVRTVHLVDPTLNAIGRLGPALGPWWAARTLFLRQFTHGDRKDAAQVNRQFLGWLDRRPRPGRPFFAFLNYADAHSPYVLPPGAPYRFGVKPSSASDFWFLLEGWSNVNKLRLNRQAQALARDSYDSCLAYLDERLGELLTELERRRDLSRTVVIVAADHGEGFGEHDLFDHGESLYRPEIRVPLLISLPSGEGAGRVVGDVVSLRDIPATVVHLVSPRAKSPFPGRSLARMWRDGSPASQEAPGDDVVLSELCVAQPQRSQQRPIAREERAAHLASPRGIRLYS